jgi:hypothetical protein
MPGNCDKNWQCNNMKYLLLSTGRHFEAKIIVEKVIIFKTYYRVVDYSHIIIQHRGYYKTFRYAESLRLRMTDQFIDIYTYIIKFLN